MIETTLSVLAVRLTHTGQYADGRPCTTSVLITDTDFGFELQTRKTPAYVPAGGFIELPLTSRTLYSLSKGSIAGFVRTGVLRADTFIRLRNFADKGGPTGDGVDLLAVVPNIRRQGGLLQFLISILECSGYIFGEQISISGLSGGYAGLDGIYTIQEVQKGVDFVGPNLGSYLVTVGSEGADIPSDALGGLTIELVNGKVGVELSGSGNAGGLGVDAMAYIGGQANITLGLDPTYLFLTPTGPSTVPSGALFVNVGTSDLTFKDGGGALIPVTGGGASNTDQLLNVSGVSGATASEALDNLQASKAPINSPTLTGVPAAPTAGMGTNTTQIATTAFVVAQIAATPPGAPAWGTITGVLANQADLQTALGLKSPLLSPGFSGTPTAPTAAVGTNTTQIATTAFVQGNVAFEHTQAVPSALWTVNHNLGRKPIVQLRDVLERVFEADVQHLDSNTLQVSMVSAIAGAARCI